MDARLRTVACLSLLLILLSASAVAFQLCCRERECPSNYYYDFDSCSCQRLNLNSPVIVDVNGDGFDLTNANNGVQFALGSDDRALQTAWTALSSDDAFLVLDRNQNGLIDNGTELFGDATPQPASSTPNGFAALAAFDLPDNGGNADGQIDSRDAIFWSLRLWRDVNHNGKSDPGELFALPALGVQSISLDYRESRRKDKFGNVFRYRAATNGTAAKFAYDVFLRTL